MIPSKTNLAPIYKLISCPIVASGLVDSPLCSKRNLSAWIDGFVEDDDEFVFASTCVRNFQGVVFCFKYGLEAAQRVFDVRVLVWDGRFEWTGVSVHRM